MIFSYLRLDECCMMPGSFQSYVKKEMMNDMRITHPGIGRGS